MKAHLECVPCLLRQAVEATKISTQDEALRKKSIRAAVTYLSKERWTKSLPEIGASIHRIVKRVTGNTDPYGQLKQEYTRVAFEFFPKLRAVVEYSEDKMLSAVKIAIAGNVIDFGPKVNIDLEKEIKNVLCKDLAINDIDRLKDSIRKTKKVLYLADNAGETVFDRVLLEELVKEGVKVTYAVKDAPILNDATFQDAEEAGITEIADVMSIGTDCMGLIFKECSTKFLRAFENSNLIISKGQGNYESLNDFQHKEIFFLLKVKCLVIAEDIGVEIGSAILKRAKSS